MKSKTTIEIPTDDEVPALTERLAEVKAQIDALSAEKKTLEARLEAYALQQPQQPLKDDSREGRQVRLRGPKRSVAVVFTSDLIIGTFRQDSLKHRELLKVLEPASAETDKSPQDLLKLFFDPPHSWANRFRDGQRFRESVAEWLPAEVAPRFIAACRQVDKHGVSKSRTTFDYHQAAEEAAEV